MYYRINMSSVGTE